MSRAGFEPATTATNRPQTYALDRAATGIGRKIYMVLQKMFIPLNPEENLHFI
jgi:hypothetical protein